MSRRADKSGLNATARYRVEGCGELTPDFFYVMRILVAFCTLNKLHQWLTGLLLEIPDTIVVELLGFTGYSGVANSLNSQR